MKPSYDVVIIGGGVTGGSTACFLTSEPGFSGSVLVVERDPTYEHAPSSRSTGGIRQQFSTRENIEIGLFGAHFAKNAERYLSIDGETPDIGFREGGYLLLATPEVLPLMEKNNVTQRACGADVHFHDPGALRARFPWLDPTGLAGGFFGVSNEGWVDPWSLVQAYKKKARASGAEYVADEVVTLERRGRRVGSLRLREGGCIEAGVVINAAGARDGAGIAAQVGVDLPIEPRKRCTFVFQCREEIGPTPLTVTPIGVAFRPEGRGFISNTAPPPGRDPVCEDTEVDYWLFEEVVWPALAERVPAFEAIKMTNSWCCHYDVNTLDENVIIGRSPEVENFYFAIGFSGHGLQQSPAIGRALSELITYGEYRTLDLTRFGYGRVMRGEALPETNCW